jgi:type 1 glutamine amidotransferase
MPAPFRVFLTLQLLFALVAEIPAQEPKAPAPRVLFFSKAASWEQKIVHRDNDRSSYIETLVEKLGKENGIAFTFSKDGTIFTPENLSRFDALFFFTSGDLTFQARNGRGDNYPLMTLAGKQALFAAVENGLGFVGCNTANYTFPERLSPGEKEDAVNAWRYARMIGAGYMGHNEVQPGSFSYLDRSFPGMEHLPADYRPVDQWYAFNRLMPDLHVLMALHAHGLQGNLYEREDYPVAWTRLQGKGRVYYTTMGHTAAIWADPAFQQMLLGGIRWATKRLEAVVTPDIAAVTPQAGEIPPHASKYIADHPPAIHPRFPNFPVRLDKDYPTHAGKRVLVYTKSAGDEPPIAYRDTVSPSPLESELLQFGDEDGVDFIFTKDNSQFTDDILQGFDAILCAASGDPTDQPRDGRGDNYPLMTPAGVETLVKAVRAGKGFISLHSTLAPRQESSAARPLIALPGAKLVAAAAPRSAALTVLDRTFPGMENVPGNFAPEADCHAEAFDHGDLHPLLQAPDGSPVTWTRVEGKGRVYATVLGQSMATWKDPTFRRMLLGAIRWVTDQADDGARASRPAR